MGIDMVVLDERGLCDVPAPRIKQKREIDGFLM